MKIIKYKKVKTNQYEIELEGTDSILLYDDIIVKHNLLLKGELSKSELKSIIEENSSYESYYIALRYLGKRMHSKKEIYQYLEKKEFSKGTILATIDKLIKQGYINEEQFTKAFIHDALAFTLDGPLKLERKLLDLGIEEDLIRSELSKVEHNIWSSKVDKVLEKRLKSIKYTEKIWKQKTESYLYQLGYSRKLVDDKIMNVNFENSDQLLEKEYQKLLRKLERKYNGQELKFQLKNKLYAKGFTLDEIDSILK